MPAFIMAVQMKPDLKLWNIKRSYENPADSARDLNSCRIESSLRERSSKTDELLLSRRQVQRKWFLLGK